MTRLAYHFRIMPWDIDRLTRPEFDAFCRSVDRLERSNAGG